MREYFLFDAVRDKSDAWGDWCPALAAVDGETFQSREIKNRQQALDRRCFVPEEVARNRTKSAQRVLNGLYLVNNAWSRN